MYGYNHMNLLQDDHARKVSSWLLFFIGLFSITQIKFPGFSLCISEFPIYIVAPFIFAKDYHLLKRHGMLFIVWLGVLVSVACVVSGIYNGTYSYFIFKGLSSTYPLFAFPVVLHRLLWNNFSGLRWLLLGIALSSVISTFIFQTSVETHVYAAGATGGDVAKAIMNGPIFWIGRLARFVDLPIQGWYLSTPIAYSVFAPIGMAAFAMLTSESGRSAALGALGGAFIAILCGKKERSFMRFSKNFYLILLISIVGILALNRGYHFVAMNGWLGDKALEKYEKQSKGSKSALRLLMGGRGEFFIGVMAALDKPIIGHGPWAIDNGGYVDEFMSKYGDEEDSEKHFKSRAHQYKTVGTIYGYIPSHSHVGSFWLWFGVVGLFYWLYVIYALFRYLHRELVAVPQWVGFLAVGAPLFLWHVFFSGFGIRIFTMPYVVLLFMAHNVYKKRIPIPMIESEQIARFC